MSRKKPADPPSYSAATQELESILDEIETGSVDLDVLSERVERAAALIKLCRDKITGTEMKLRKVIDQLETDLEQGEGVADGDE